MSSLAALILISDSLVDVPCIQGYDGDTQIVSWTLDEDEWLQSYSDLNQSTSNKRQASRI